ncbi:MAG: hypothetical protein OXH69_17020, partial [Acidobacteria bacterium]|nr:hypothetical protein [Acidobacteriota bacterium]
MKRIKPALDSPAALALALLCLVPLAIGSPAAQSDDDAIATALMAAPPALAGSAMVIRLDDAGEYEVLREGDNDLVCWDRSDQPNMSFSVQCTSVGNLPRIQQNRAWAMSGQSAEEIRALQDAAEADGTREVSVYGSMYYTVAGADADSAGLHMTIAVPFATGESLGLPEEGSYTRAGTWVMQAGTSAA